MSVYACMAPGCDRSDVPADAPGVCEECAGPLISPVCPPWCEHPTSRLEASIFTHTCDVGTVDLETGGELAVWAVLEGDADAPRGPVEIRTAVDFEDLSFSSPETLRAVANLLERAAETLERLQATV